MSTNIRYQAKYCITYVRDDGSLYAVVGKQDLGEPYEKFAQRMFNPGYDWRHKGCTIMSLETGVRRGFLPLSVLD